MRWLRFILSHSIFISFCAVALCFQTVQLLHIEQNGYLYGLIFFSTLSSYNFYWLISKYYFNRQWGIAGFLKRNSSNLVLFLLAAVGVCYCICCLPGITSYVGLAVALTLLYSVPLWPVKALSFTKKAGFLKTCLLAFTWAYVTVIIPVWRSVPLHNLPLELLFATRFLFMLMLCIIFDSRDIAVDKIHSLRSLATDVSRATLHIIMVTVFLLYLAAGLLLRYHFSSRAQVAAFLITGLVSFAVYRLSLKKQGYFFYYFIVDGLMLFSAAATFVAGI